MSLVKREEYEVNPTLAQTAREIVAGMQQARSDMHKMCVKYVEFIGAYPEMKVFFIQECGLRSTDLLQMERVGRGKLHPLLVDKSGVGFQKLRQCAYSDQAKYLGQPVDLLLQNGDVLKVQVSDLTKEQAAQVFNFGSIRDLAGQRAYIENETRTTTLKIAQKRAPYTVTKQGLRIGALLLTKTELLNILAEM